MSVSTRKRARATGWLAAAALACSAAAQAQGKAAQDRMDIPPPSSWAGGWVVAANESGEGWSKYEFQPAKQDADSSRQAVVLLEVWSGNPRDRAARLLRSWEAELRRICPEVKGFRGAAPHAHGFNVAYAQFLCPRSSDTGEGSVHFVKTISSQKRTYLIASLRLSAPFTVSGRTAVYADTAEADALNRWLKGAMAYLEKQVHACEAHSELVSVCSP